MFIAGQQERGSEAVSLLIVHFLLRKNKRCEGAAGGREEGCGEESLGL